ncbi:hypothetical protein UA08_04303 [Talaromyces atroroseus]|uniref:F-box domain-containing protein n=1 Tax=Talaromyces atroroseus TaxID=1441469 RepID=A0A1Q5Q8U7_TALAT|nr:hypothetical protein UA08_04303 [Talaromyces atroroseus]OKL60534.1 hypothetical protein UA08_04303 [Talaromyces atroroseus]
MAGVALPYSASAVIHRSCNDYFFRPLNSVRLISQLNSQHRNWHRASRNMEKSSLPRLPNELLGIVIENADGPTRASLARTCHALNALATPYLYRWADIKQGKSNEFMRTVSNKYASLVHHVTVVIDDQETSPCRIVPCLDKLESLQSLELTGGYWMWDDEDEDGEEWDTLEEILWNYLERASLKQTAESRVSENLRSLTLDRCENNGQGAFLHYSHVFIIPQLHHLTLRGFMLEEADGDFEPQFERQTELKSLRIERCFVSFPALRSALRAPRALRYLSIGHAEYYSHHELQNVQPNNATLADFMDALLLHRESLEEIRVVVEDHYGTSHGEFGPTINHPSFHACAKQFAELKRWEGCDRRTLAYYLGGLSYGSSSSSEDDDDD